MSAPEERPLEGVLVADLTVTLPGPYCTNLLLRLGARVIKFEPPQGDIIRGFPHLHAAVDSGKESVVVDLDRANDLELVRSVARRADVLVEGWRPGVAARLGLGPDDLLASSPALVYCSISGYGTDDDRRDRAGHDLNYMAASGMTKLLSPGEPRNFDVPVADLAGGTFAALRICAALFDARGAGKGRHLDVSLCGSTRDWVEALGANRSGREAGWFDRLPHYGVFETADGHQLTLATVYEDTFWQALCAALDLADLAGLGAAERMARVAELRKLVAESIGSRTRRELESVLGGVDTCWAFVEHPDEAGAIGGMLPRGRADVPALGQDGDAVRAEFAR